MHQHLRRFPSGGKAPRVQEAAALAVENPLFRGPAQSRQGPGAGLVCIGEGQVLGRGRLAPIAPEDYRQLFPGDVVIGPKLAAAVAGDDALFCRPGDGLGIPLAVVYVLKAPPAASGLRSKLCSTTANMPRLMG